MFDKIQKLIKWTRTNSPTYHAGGTVLPPIGDSFLCLSNPVQIITVLK